MKETDSSKMGSKKFCWFSENFGISKSNIGTPNHFRMVFSKIKSSFLCDMIKNTAQKISGINPFFLNCRKINVWFFDINLKPQEEEENFLEIP